MQLPSCRWSGFEGDFRATEEDGAAEEGAEVSEELGLPKDLSSHATKSSPSSLTEEAREVVVL